VCEHEQCPHCHQPINKVRLGVPLTPLKAAIFDAIRRAGPDGIDTDILFWLVFGERERPVSRQTLKSHVWQINDAIADTGFRIKGNVGVDHRFTLVKRAA
jgi:hypothetical protein